MRMRSKLETPSWKKVLTLGKVLWEEKAEDIVIIGLEEDKRAIADFFLIATVTSDTHARALTSSLVRFARSEGYGSGRIEESKNAAWTVLDFGDVVVHLFLPKLRAFYRLERIYEAAPFFLLTERDELQPITLQDVLQLPSLAAAAASLSG